MSWSIIESSQKDPASTSRYAGCNASRARLLATSLFALTISGSAVAQTQERWTQSSSDPSRFGWMAGFPPPPGKTIRGYDRDFFAFPKLRWTVCHFRQLMPTVAVSRGIGAPVPFETAIDKAIDAIEFTPTGKRTKMTWRDSLAANFTDGIVVLHRGRIVYEKYFGCLNRQGKHAAMSVTKSMIGLLGEILVAEGTLDENTLVAKIIPELASSAFGTATVKQVLEMTTGLKYSENYSDPRADVWTYSASGSPWPKPAGYKGPRSYFDYLKTVKPQGKHGEAFGYKTVNTDALAWIISRTTGKSIPQLLSQRVWSRIGAEQSAYFTVDSTGTPFSGGGFNAGLRDMALIGQLMLNEGEIHGRRLFPASVVTRIKEGGDKAAFAKGGFASLPGGSYRSMWWLTHNEHGAFAARGVHGQTIYIDPKAQMVIARFASHPQAKNAAIDPTSLPAYHALARYLMTR